MGAGLETYSLAAARALMAGPFAHWNDPERTVINVDALYRDFRGAGEHADRVALFGQLLEIKYLVKK